MITTILVSILASTLTTGLIIAILAKHIENQLKKGKQ